MELVIDPSLSMLPPETSKRTYRSCFHIPLLLRLPSINTNQNFSAIIADTTTMSQPSKTGFMPAVQWEGTTRSMSVKIVRRPKLVDPEDALVRITSSAICGSDLHIYHGLFGTEPHGVGHEAVGIVEEVGPAVDSFKRGDRVVVVCFAEDGHLLAKPSLQLLNDEVGYGLGSQFGTDDGLQSTYAP